MIGRGSRHDRKIHNEHSVLDPRKADPSTALRSGRNDNSSRAGHPGHGEVASPEPTAPEILRLITQYMAVLTVERASSEHTVRAYQRELHSFAMFLAKRCGEDVVPSQIEHPVIREYLGTLYEKNLSKPSVARALAAIRSWFGWLARTGHIEQNPARLVSTPKLPKHLPRVPGAEQLNQAMNDVDAETAWPERDRVILELLYGCGIRNAELVGLNLGDIQWGNECILVRGKGPQGAVCSAGRCGGDGDANVFAAAGAETGWTRSGRRRRCY